MRSTVVLPALAVCIALLGGCSIYSAPGTKPAPVEKAPEPAVKPPATAPQTRPSTTTAPASAAYQPLLDKAAQARSRGDYEESLALLQRAQRIDPDSAQIYLAMAATHQARGDISQARAVAERGLLYCNGTRECDALRSYTR